MSASADKRLLLHACCGPCSLEPVRILREAGWDLTICWTNPNIQPVAEHDRRLETLMAWTREVSGAQVIIAADDRGAWEREVAPHGMDRVERCRACYALRLEELCRMAEERGFPRVSTTLAVSPYQLFDDCSRILAEKAASHGLEAVIEDFRPFYNEAVRISRELGMYRQCYCGCRFSAAEAAASRHAARDARKAGRAADEFFPG